MPDPRSAAGGRGRRRRLHGHSRSHRLRAQDHTPQGCLQLRRAATRRASRTRPEHQPWPGHRRHRTTVSRAAEGPGIWICLGPNPPHSHCRWYDHDAGRRTATHRRIHC
jgi:hypothetical protein